MAREDTRDTGGDLAKSANAIAALTSEETNEEINPMNTASPHIFTIAGVYELDHLAQWTSHWVDAAGPAVGITSSAWFVHASAGILLSVTASILYWNVARTVARLLSWMLNQVISFIDWSEAALKMAGNYVFGSAKRLFRDGLANLMDKLRDDD